ncbi:MAG: cellulase family glycosylhydrolase [Chloroflexota bacterium]|nr:cellulase family glycosylhydrolase [Chloroflexota bacterium]
MNFITQVLNSSNVKMWHILSSCALALAVVVITAPENTHAYSQTPVQQACLNGPLSTEGAKIVSAKGEECVLTGVNWFGFETQSHVVHGLWTRGYDDMLAQISGLGFNVIRMPFSIEAIESEEITNIDFSAGRNADLAGSTPLEAMELIIDTAAEQGILVLLDLHSLKGDNHFHGLWYDDAYSEADFSSAWETITKRFGEKPNVIGADLKNEPHGEATWGGVARRLTGALKLRELATRSIATPPTGSLSSRGSKAGPRAAT